MSALLDLAADPLVTITVSIDRNGDVFEDTQCHGNSWADVYRGKRAVLERVKFLVEEHRQCPFHPRARANTPEASHD